MKAVLIVEDHSIVAEAMRLELKSADADLGTVICRDAAMALAHLRRSGQSWHRIFLDLAIPGARGLSVAREIADAGHASICCIVTANDSQEFASEARALGFLGYILKACSFQSFQQAIHAVLQGQRQFPPMTRERRSIELTNKQLIVLDLVRRGLSSKLIADKLHRTEGTINNTIAAAMRALDVTSRSHAISKAFDLGILEAHDDFASCAPDRSRSAS